MTRGWGIAALVMVAYPWLFVYVAIWGGWRDALWLIALGVSIVGWLSAEPDPLGESA